METMRAERNENGVRGEKNAKEEWSEDEKEQKG